MAKKNNNSIAFDDCYSVIEPNIPEAKDKDYLTLADLNIGQFFILDGDLCVLVDADKYFNVSTNDWYYTDDSESDRVEVVDVNIRWRFHEDC